MKTCALLLCLAPTAALAPRAALAAPAEDELGGPLEGLKLPLYKTHHGEPPGYPGVMNGKTTEGVYPDHELFPGSVEHYHAYFQKYLPVKSLHDAQSLLRNWQATELAQLAGVATEPYAEPVYRVPRHAQPEFAGVYNDPVAVVRCKAAAPVFKIDLGELPVGMYCLKTVGAVETKDIQRVRKALYFTVRINDGLGGEVSSYRQRIGYVDDFYSVSEVFFHAPAKRRYTAELQVDGGSLVDLLVHNIELHDTLAGIDQRPLKTRMTLQTSEERARLRAAMQKANPQRTRDPLPHEARWTRDAAFWSAYPRINYQSSLPASNLYGVREEIVGANGLKRKDIIEKYGSWEVTRTGDKPTVLMVNSKLGLTYTMADAAQQKPLPDPYPFHDDGAGLQFAAAAPGGVPQNWLPVGEAQWGRVYLFVNEVVQEADGYNKYGDPEQGRDAALKLIRFAYDFPSENFARMFPPVLEQPGSDVVRDNRSRWRETYNMHLDFYGNYPLYSEAYDKLYDLIAGNDDLAQSVHRFVPWVQTSKDIIQLLDAYLVQHSVKSILRYHWYTTRTGPATQATVLGDRTVTDPWMNWLFTRTFIYPLPPSGIQDMMITGYDREGAQVRGSTFYEQAEAAYEIAQDLETYIRSGGNPEFNLSDSERYPKPLESCYWQYRILAGGLQFLRIGDVTGPDKNLTHTWTDTLDLKSRLGWRWSRDPKFAFLIKHYFGRKSESDAEWQAIETAAAGVPRAPFLDSKSRVLPEWAAILESGTQHDDFRFRRAAYLRVGEGWGHHHDDPLDLQIVAHGLPMTVDGGQRPSYSRPDDRNSRVHNMVEVDGAELLGHAWVNTLTDVPGTRYTRATVTPPGELPQLKHYARQIALLDVDEGEGSKPLSPAQTQPNAKLDPVARTANSYVFDVVRVAGGKRHTYCFHGSTAEPNSAQPVTNARDVHTLGESAPTDAVGQRAAEYLRKYAGARYYGSAPADFEATFAIQKERTGEGLAFAGTEKFLMGPSYDASSPLKQLRLHLLGAADAMVLKGDQNCVKWNYFIPNIYVQRQGDNLESAFAAIIEPFAGTAFLTRQARLAVAGNESDALQAVAVAVDTANGHRDLCFADGRPEKVREVRDGAQAVRVAGEFGYISHDAQGLRQASLTGGTLLETADMLLAPAQRERTGKVTKVDYNKRTLWLDTVWPALNLAENLFEIGSPAKTTQYSAVAVQPQGRSTAIRVAQGADYYQSRVQEADAKTGEVVCTLAFAINEGVPQMGQNRDWVASNDAMTKFWRAEYLGGARDESRYRFKLTGGPVTRADFGEAGALRLWEYGVGDSVRQSTFVSLQRTADGVYRLSGNVDTRLALVGKRLEISSDAKSWKPIPTTAAAGRATASIKLAALPGNAVYVRVVK